MLTLIQYSILVYLSALYLARCAVIEPIVEISEIETNVTNDKVTETQHAVCKIATDELVANAHATVTRVLTGACNTRILEKKLDALEENVTKYLTEIKELLHNLVQEKQINNAGNVRESIELDSNKFSPAKVEFIANDKSLPRQEEINFYNNTIQRTILSNGTEDIFFYYWQIKNFYKKLMFWEIGQSERSPTFYVGQEGYAMYLRITPKYFPDGTIFVGVGLARGRYDSVLEWPFPLRIRLEILDQSMGELQEDKSSRIWEPSTLCSEQFWGRPKLNGNQDNPQCVGLSVSKETILSSLEDFPEKFKYLWHGNLMIKLTIYNFK